MYTRLIIIMENWEEIVGKERQVLGTNFLGWDQPDRNSIKAIPPYLADNAKKLLRL